MWTRFRVVFAALALVGGGMGSASLTAGVAGAASGNPDTLQAMGTSPLQLFPAFAPSIHDYYVRCAAGTNSLTIVYGAKSGGKAGLVAPIVTEPKPSRLDTVDLAEGQAAVIAATDGVGGKSQYWIRCLPHDFPQINVTPHPQAGAPTPGWYLTGTISTPVAYAMILDTNGTPVWYRRAIYGWALDVTPLDTNQVAYMKATTPAGIVIDPNGKFDVYHLDTKQRTHIHTVNPTVNRPARASAAAQRRPSALVLPADARRRSHRAALQPPGRAELDDRRLRDPRGQPPRGARVEVEGKRASGPGQREHVPRQGHRQR